MWLVSTYLEPLMVIISLFSSWWNRGCPVNTGASDRKRIVVVVLRVGTKKQQEALGWSREARMGQQQSRRKGPDLETSRQGADRLTLLTVDYGEWIMDHCWQWVAFSVRKRQDSDVHGSCVCTHDGAVIHTRRSKGLWDLWEGSISFWTCWV